MVPNVWYTAYGTQSKVLKVWYLILRVWYTEYGIVSMYLPHRVWYTDYGNESMLPGYDTQSMVLKVR